MEHAANPPRRSGTAPFTTAAEAAVWIASQAHRVAALRAVADAYQDLLDRARADDRVALDDVADDLLARLRDATQAGSGYGATFTGRDGLAAALLRSVGGRKRPGAAADAPFEDRDWRPASPLQRHVDLAVAALVGAFGWAVQPYKMSVGGDTNVLAATRGFVNLSLDYFVGALARLPEPPRDCERELLAFLWGRYPAAAKAVAEPPRAANPPPGRTPLPIAYSVVGMLKTRAGEPRKRVSRADLSRAIALGTAARQREGLVKPGTTKLTPAGRGWVKTFAKRTGRTAVEVMSAYDGLVAAAGRSAKARKAKRGARAKKSSPRKARRSGGRGAKGKGRPRMDFDIVGRSNTGYARKNNEDSFAVEASHGFAVVADGMGGHAGGEVASALACAAVARVLVASPAASAEELARAVHEANRVVWERGRTDPNLSGMGTTLVALASIGAGRVALANVGDSRIYRLRGGELRQFTTDHVGYARNIITRAVGTFASVDVDASEIDAVRGDIFILGSDGLHGMISDAEIARLAGGDQALTRRADRLIEAALAAGGRDNVTVVLARALTATRPVPSRVDAARSTKALRAGAPSATGPRRAR